MPDFEEMMNEVNEEIQEKDAEQDIISRIPELKRLNADIEKAITAVINTMFADERKKVRERYKEYDGCYLSHYAQWFFWLFFSIGFFVVASGIGMIIAQFYR